MDNESILISVLQAIGYDESVICYDNELITQINAAFSTLRQLGVGPNNGYRIENRDNKWEEFEITSNARESILADVKTYINLKTRRLFDPPSSSSVMDSINQAIAELESRLKYDCDV